MLARRFPIRTLEAIGMLIALGIVVGVTTTALAQIPPPPPVIPNPAPETTLRTFFTNRTPYEFWLTCIIGIVALTIVAALIWAVGRTTNPRPEDVTRPVIVIAVIFSTLILVTAGYSNDQIAPAFGLFGTIVGYLLGRAGPAGAPAPAPGRKDGVTPPPDTGPVSDPTPPANSAKTAQTPPVNNPPDQSETAAKDTSQGFPR